MKLITNSRILTGLLLAMGVTMLGLGAVNVLAIPLIINDMHLPPTWFGLVEFSQTAGMILSGSLVAIVAAKIKPGNIIGFAPCLASP